METLPSKVQAMVLSKRSIGPFNWEEFLTPTHCEETEKLLQELDHCERLGLREPARKVNLELMALGAEQKGLFLLEVKFYNPIRGLRPWGDGRPYVHKIRNKDLRSRSIYGHMNITPFKKFEERIPLNILDKLPTNMGNAVIFSKATDPIIAVPIARRKKFGFYLGVFIWG